MKKNVLPSKLNLESPVPGAESASEEVHRRWQEVLAGLIQCHQYRFLFFRPPPFLFFA